MALQFQKDQIGCPQQDDVKQKRLPEFIGPHRRRQRDHQVKNRIQKSHRVALIVIIMKQDRHTSRYGGPDHLHHRRPHGQKEPPQPFRIKREQQQGRQSQRSVSEKPEIRKTAAADPQRRIGEPRAGQKKHRRKGKVTGKFHVRNAIYRNKKRRPVSLLWILNPVLIRTWPARNS